VLGAGIAGRQPVEYGLELPLEHAHLRCLLADLAYSSGQVRAQPGLQRPALAGRPGRDQAGDVFQAHPDALGPANERQLIRRGLIEDPVAAGCPPRGRQQPGTLVKAHRRRRHPGAFGQLGGPQTVHAPRVNLQLSFKVKAWLSGSKPCHMPRNREERACVTQGRPCRAAPIVKNA
jgi:hypothetical protein